MSEIVLHDMSEYPQVLRRVFQSGERRSPRGLNTLDLGFTSIVILNQRRGMPLGLGRNLNPAIGAVEAVQLIAGVSDPDLVLRLAPQFGRYTDEDEQHDTAKSPRTIFWGAYGERIKEQARLAIRKLTIDPNSRQAIITLWDPWLDNVDGKHDYPCTIALHFFLRNGLVDMNVIMRSNDAWLGLPYDVFQFTQLQASVAKSLNTQPGIYRHTALSLHLYERDADTARELVATWTPQSASGYHKTWQPDGVGHPGQSFGDIMLRARALIDNASIVDETESERWYRAWLHPSNVG